MVPDDQFRENLRRTTLTLSDWAAEMHDVADIEKDMTDGILRFAVDPYARGACPIEFGIRSDQTFDLAIADQLFEDRAADDLSVFPELVRAVARGDVIRQRFIRQATGIEAGVRMVVRMENGSTWSDEMQPISGLADGEPLLVEGRHFVPYRLGWRTVLPSDYRHVFRSDRLMS